MTGLADIRDVSFINNFESKYLKGLEMEYEVDGKKMTCEYNVKMSSVSILLYHTVEKNFLLVRQFRPAIYTSSISRMSENKGKKFNEINWSSYSSEIGYTMELCAGLMDKPHLGAEETACEEIFEECGYKVDWKDLKKIASFVVGSHQSGTVQHMFYAEIDDSMKMTEGGGNVEEGEVITKVKLSLSDAEKLIFGEISKIKSPPGVLLAFQWWFLMKRNGGIMSKETKEAIKYEWKPTELRRIKNIKFSDDFDKNKYNYNPLRMQFTMNGLKRFWDLSLSASSSACVLYDSEKKQALMVEMFRPQVFVGRSRFASINKNKKLNEIDFDQMDPITAYDIELLSGRVNDGESFKNCAQRILNSVGFEISMNEIKEIANLMPGIGQSGDEQHLFAVDVTKAKPCPQKNEWKLIRIDFDNLHHLYSQDLIGPPNVYYGIGYLMQKIVGKNL